MNEMTAEVAATIDAPAARVYAVLRDYEGGHAAILPPDTFRELVVLEGGQGEGTRLRLRMEVMGEEVVSEQVVSEPEPGRVLVETDEKGMSQTTFTVEPAGANQARVTIHTELRTKPGLRGMVERVLTPRLLERVYREELERLNEYVQRDAAGGFG